MAQYDALLKPFAIKNVTIRNRIMSTAHAPAYSEAGKPKERYQIYHEEKARGGIGLTMFGGSTGVSIDSKLDWGALSAHDDTIIPYFREFAERIHRHGAKLMVQITHMGRWAHWDLGDWFVPVAPSATHERAKYQYPKALEDWDIRRIIADFGQATRRSRDGDLDGVEISAHGSSLFDQFWSPLHNHRTDQYGGSLENRMRFGIEVLEELRRVVGDDYVIGMRMAGDEIIKGGHTPEDCLKIACHYAESGLLDFLNISAGQTYTYMVHAQLTPGMALPVAPYLHLASTIKAEVDIPIFQATRINDLATAARAVEDGHVDLVGMTRAHIADPHVVRKLMEGRVEDVRECVGAVYCMDRLYFGSEALCIHNAATGREQSMPHVISKAAAKRKMVVVGAGPGGLEAARVSRERGHDVILFEAADRTGGQINLATRATWRENLSGIPRWLDTQVRKLGVDLRLDIEASAEDVLAEQADMVVIATGGRPNKGRFHDSDLVTSTWDILSGAVSPGENVLVYDDHGENHAVSCAEVMAAQGALVEIVTPEQKVAPLVGITNRPIHMRELHKRGVIMTPDMRMVGIDREGNKIVVILRNDYSGQEEKRVVDQVVVEHGTLPRDELYFALKPHSSNLGEIDFEALLAGRPQAIATNPDGNFQLFRIGDAVASRNIHAAIYESLRLCKDS